MKAPRSFGLVVVAALNLFVGFRDGFVPTSEFQWCNLTSSIYQWDENICGRFQPFFIGFD